MFSKIPLAEIHIGTCWSYHVDLFSTNHRMLRTPLYPAGRTVNTLCTSVFSLSNLKLKVRWSETLLLKRAPVTQVLICFCGVVSWCLYKLNSRCLTVSVHHISILQAVNLAVHMH